MSKTIVVIGVTGLQGSSVAKTFLKFPGWRVRGVTRNPSSPAAQALTADGAKLFKGDLDDKASLIPAFEGATVIFSNTDFFGHFFGSIASSKDDLGGRTPNQYAFDREVKQGVNIAEAAASPVVLKTLEKFVLSSLSDATKWSKGKYTGVYHNDCKAEMIRVIEARFPEIAARMSTLQVGHYVTNWKTFPPMAPQKQADGSFIIQRPWAPDFVLPWVVTHKDTGAFVKALVDSPPGTNLLGTSEDMTMTDWTKLWGETLGEKASVKQVSYHEFFNGVPDPMKLEFTQAFSNMEEFGYTGGDPDVLTVEQLGVQIPRTSMEEYIKNEDWSSVLRG
ncbi:NmrA-like family domain-containing protein [Lachnellula suecica]|uniref:NmrA-like family domain-containing protein n=1 Tax=Lachnellula suecica TaxID=602035 RepID=A0A8T9CER9_9HELO|nr:NmrA-like family domain-containing protein [Lachnellula suecica]